MKVRFFSRFTVHSLVAMAISWLFSAALVVMFDGTGEFNEMVSYATLLLSFVLIAWTGFIFPFLRYFNLFLQRPQWRIYFPVMMVFYSLSIFALLFSLVFGVRTMISVVGGGNILAITAALIGGMWGLLYTVLYMFERRRAYVN